MELKIGVSNFKSYESGLLLGFFTLEYCGLEIKNCRLMQQRDSEGYWISMPQIKVDDDGETKFVNILWFTDTQLKNEVTFEVLAELAAQGHIEKPKQPVRHITPEGEDLSEYYYQGGGDNIPF